MSVTSAASPSVETALNRWRSNLIDLSRRNPLIALRPTRSAYLEITQPGPADIFDTLVRKRKPWHFHLPPEKANSKAAKPKPTELLTAAPDRNALLHTLTNLYRRYRADFRERGLHILYLALGILEWRDEDDAPTRSPLVLVPVELRRHSLREPFVLETVEEDILINPALEARLLQDFDFRLPPPPEDWDEPGPEAYFAAVEQSFAGLPGWQVQRGAVLSLFSFHKGVIFQDLQDNAEPVKAHPLVQALAGLPVSLPRVELPDERSLDTAQDPHGCYHILDADGSQRLSLEAAARGESFVLIGPPGTGKSQTIANLIADRLAHGQRVLFVSDKMAALEVVYERLRHVGLGDYCLELHSHKANKRAVVAELARCLDERRHAPKPAGDDDFTKLQQRREQLNGYVEALHRPREPMNRSAWDALAELPRWQDLPLIPLGLPAVRQPGEDAARLVVGEFTPAHLDELTQLLKRFQNLWHVRNERDFPWRGFKAERYSLQLRDEVLGLIDKVRGRGDRLRTAADQYGQQLGVTGSIAGLLKLGELLEKRPPLVSADWLRTTDLPNLTDELERCAEQYQRLGQSRQPLTERYGAALWQLPDGSAARVEQAWKSAAALLSPQDERGAEFLKLQQKLRAWAAETQKRVPAWLTEVRTLDKWLSLPLPIGAGSTANDRLDPSLENLRHFLRLVNLCQTDHPADRTWLQDPATLAKARELTAALRPVGARFKQGRAYLLPIYHEKVLDLDLSRMAEAYAGSYRSVLRFFSGQFWRDRKKLKRASRNDEVPASAAHDVAVGRDVLADKARIEADLAQNPGLLGRYAKGIDTDTDAAEKAAALAGEAVELAKHLGHATMPAKLVDALASGSPPEKVRASLKRLNESFAGWWHLTEELQALLPMRLLPGVGEPLDECALSALVGYAKGLQGALNQFAAAADPVLQRSPVDVPALLADLMQAEELRAFEASQEADARRYAARFGPAFKGVDTDWDSLRKGVAWTRRVRNALASMQAAPTDAFIKQATGIPPPVRDLRQALEQYEHALHGLEIRFDAPGPVLDGKPLREQGPDAVLAHLAKLRDRVGALADWVDWRHLPERFQHLGLGAFWDRLQEEAVPREQVIDLFLKAFWSAWLDAVFQQDAALSGFRRADHDQAVAEFRNLDRKLIGQGATRVAGRLGAIDRPDDDPEVKLLTREANKKTKHLALRRLFDEMPGLIQQLKPCLLMSPLSVSQFLPADLEKLRFDVVVFDEASQLLPEDAIGAIYRGRQLVVTGDNRQLPPTTFFQQNADDGEDADEEEQPLFESVLDACLAAGLPRRMLRWHYRSRHEQLIAFSNESYYDGKLVTFPAALQSHPGLGVKFHHVADGVYDRGGRRDNPRKAQAVAGLVLDHFRQTPQKTLGVIAFSYAQMEAIEDEIDRQLEAHPDLEGLGRGGRLEGFFVKNLETVQGDERDVILLSVGYGKDAAGKVALNFGPLNRPGGERRLNVAVTRRRERLVVVGFIRACDLDLSGSSAAGVAHLHRYLDFAERGIEALKPAEQTAVAPTGLHVDVRRELKKLGYDAVPHVGCGAFRIDLGVLDPARPGSFLLGIEFDGPAYARADTARDRDRIRPEVLAQLGWRLHRVWSPDWLHRKQDEVARLAAALAAVGQAGQ